MSRKDYRQFAALVKRQLQEAQPSQHCERVVREGAFEMARIFADDNPRFSRSKFLAACGIEE